MIVAASVSPPVIAGSTSETPNQASLSVPTGSFSETVVRGTRGEKINISAAADSQATLNLGSPENGFWVQMNFSGSTEVTLDTYQTNIDDIVSGGQIEQTARRQFGRPLAATTYDMNITINGREVARGKFIIEPYGESKFVDDIDTWIAPASNGMKDVERPSELSNAIPIDAGENATVPQGRWVAFRVNTSGFNDGFLRSGANASDLFSATFTEVNPDINKQPHTFDSSEVRTFESVQQEDALYLFVNTGRHGINAGSTYRVNVSAKGNSPFIEYPESITTNFTVIEPQVNVEYSSNPMVVNSTATLRGTTTLLPGETINVTAKYDGVPPILETKETEVRMNQTFAVTFDLSNVRRGDRVIFTLPDQKKSYKAVRAWDVRLNYTGDSINLQEDAKIAGEAKLEPGSQFEVQAKYKEGATRFTKTKQVVVTQTGEFAVNFDLSDASPKGNLSIRIPEYNKTVPAVLTETPPTITTISTVSTPTTTTTTQTTTKTTATTQTPTTTTKDVITQRAINESLTQRPKESGQSIPGFTAMSSLVGLLSVLLLMLRRA
ncbi:BGTF surface domain-containing protein [Halorussus salinus]|uniref:BGTF surface domain-containing protein n=1 Tax=Halorussus salinus TaxID=1364935 RepID=UPI00192F92D6|nr:BGTF surface domain-containing protein [Halorussus salinus]